MTVKVLFGVCLYVVKSCLTHGSPMVSSTPGGIEIGVRPSLDGRAADAENCRRPCAAGATSAGTRNEGSVMTDAGERMVAAALVLQLGTSMFARGDGEARRPKSLFFASIAHRTWCTRGSSKITRW